jgi:hypothetical protein
MSEPHNPVNEYPVQDTNAPALYTTYPQDPNSPVNYPPQQQVYSSPTTPPYDQNQGFFAPQPVDPNNPPPQQYPQMYDPNQPYVQQQPVMYDPNQPQVVYAPPAQHITTTVVTTNSNTSVMGDGLDKQQFDMAILLLVGGFFFPVIWIVCFFITRSQSPRCKKLGLIALILFILTIVSSVVATILIIIINVAVAAARAAANSKSSA